ncbi:hypothetical protein COV18_01630 [Candidatus Woesearchaeota archaeon CG10_big_fil_rev_8_21_14_0_10_37_12]|nr:MAG: hypothetical protein COV18_01630 [Candidatus Woesearchaeota archaeon CG10_big_fil_rev_8_21_14_0_10_37_12]
MDVSNLLKVNSLAQELKKHRFAESSEDAFRQAQEAIEPRKQAMPLSESMQVDRPTAALEIRKVELLLEQNKQYVDQQLSLFRSTINQLIGELNSVRSQLGKFSESHPIPKDKQVPLKTEPKVEHPRQGNFKPEDVDIQKMFYFGNK